MNHVNEWIWRIGIFLAAIALVIGVCGELGFDLLFGWLGFLSHVLPAITVRRDGITVFALATLALVLIGHFFLRWFFAEIAQRSEQPRFRWRLGSSLAVVGLVLVMFIAGISMIGITHQTIWLCTSPETIYGAQPKQNYGWNRSNTVLQDMGTAVQNYQDRSQHVPTRYEDKNLVASFTQAPQSWVTKIVPYLFHYLPVEVDLQEPWNSPKNGKHFKKFVPEVLNPELHTPPLRDKDGFALNHYAGNSHIFDETTRPIFMNSSPESANTLLIGEVNANFVAWGKPENSRDPLVGINSPQGFGGPSHAKSTKFLMLDGSTRSLSHQIDPEVLKEMSSPK